MAATKQLPAGLTLARADILAPEIKPYVWSAANSGGRVVLSGMAPSAAIREAIFQSATRQFPGQTVVNDMGIARGAPDGDIVAAAGVALAELARLGSGDASFEDGRFSISGQGRVNVTSEIVTAETRAALPAPFTLARADIREFTASPYVFSLALADGKATLTGYAPDDKTRHDILEAARAAFFNAAIEDHLNIAKGAPTNFGGAIRDALPSLARLSSGTLTLTDASLAVEGQAVYEKAADQVKGALERALPGGFKYTRMAIVAQPPAAAIDPKLCQPKFDGVLARGQILFETASATISPASAAVLDTLVDIVQACRNADVEVSGHTDSVGQPDRNLDLSKRRAQAVVDYFAAAGLDTSRVTSAGYGDTKPIASNDTADGRAHNRRIEFLVK